MRLGSTGLGRFVLGRVQRATVTATPSTGPFHGSVAVVTILAPTSTAITGYIKQAKLARNIATKDVTGISNASRIYVANITGATFTVSGNFDATFDGYLNSIVQSITGFSYAPAGTSAGQIRYTAAADLTDYEVTSPKDNRVTVTATFDMTGTPTREVIA